MARVIFMGTPDFAVPALDALAEAPDVTVVGVVTRRDRPAGRGRALEAPPVKRAALARGLLVPQPGSLRRPDAFEQLRALKPDLIVVAAFGQILPPDVLDLPPHGCLNIHASLLPRFRGASPIAAAILAGDAETGVTIMRMDAGLDTGAIVASARLAIAPDDTAASLTPRLARLGADLLVATLPGWMTGAIVPIPQDAAAATMTRLIHKGDGVIDWGMSAGELERRVRAFTPWPGTATTWRGQPIKVIAAHALAPGDVPPEARESPPGTVLAWGRGAGAKVAVICGDGTALALDVIQLPGKRALPASAVARGRPALVGARLPS